MRLAKIWGSDEVKLHYLTYAPLLNSSLKAAHFTLKAKQGGLLLGNVDCPNKGAQASSISRHWIWAKIARACVGAARLF